MKVKYKSLVCCNGHMNVVSSYFSGTTWYVFQCPMCGTIQEVSMLELDVVEVCMKRRDRI